MLSILIYLLSSLELHLWLMAVPRLGVNGGVAASLHHILGQHKVLNPLSEAKEQTHVLMDTSRVWYQ